MKQYLLLVMLLAAALLLSACAPKQPAPQPTAVATAEPTASDAPTSTPQAERSPAAQKAEYRKIRAEQAKARMDSGDQVLVLDVRTPEEYAAGHIEGALLLPLNTIGEDTKEVISDLNAELLVYCRSGNRSHTASMLLLGLGYTNVHDFGGVNSWPYGLVTE